MFILRMLSLMPEQSETNNHTSECDDVKTPPPPPPPPPPQLPSTSRNLWMVPFLLGGLRIDMFAPKGA